MHRSGSSARHTIWDASLSTMWTLVRDEPFASFFPQCRAMGFAHQELNHSVTEVQLAAVDSKDLSVSSIHEPAPCDTPRKVRQAEGLHISSLDETVRVQVVEWVRGSIRLAHHLGAAAVVIHSGEIPMGRETEARMLGLCPEGPCESSELLDLRARFLDERGERAPAHLSAVCRSLLELAPAAEALGVRLGIENRDHIHQIPSFEEMDELLRLCPDVIGYWHDAGHAERLDRLGFTTHRQWLERFGPRMVGIHLHDYDGEKDHIAPGLGIIDWAMIAEYLPREAIRTFEVRGFTTPGELAAAQELLYAAGCIEPDDRD